MSTGVEVRRAGIDDAVAIAEVHVASWREAYAGVLPESLLAALSVERHTAGWRERLAGDDQSAWVAVESRGVVGFASVGKARDTDPGRATGELYAIYVAPSALGGGVGHQLHEAAVGDLGARYEQAVLWVLDGNVRARAFYERHGWSLDGAVKTERRGDAVLDEVRYRRGLNPPST